MKGSRLRGVLEPLRLGQARLVSAVFLLSLIAVACTPEAATSRGERVTGSGEVTPVPTVAVAEINAPPTVVVPATAVPEGPEPLTVVSLLGETGVMATLDGPAIAGVVAEIDRLNEQGGLLSRPIELQRFNTESRTSLAERFALRLVEDPPDLLITSCDTEFSEPVLEVADQAGILTISPCADDIRYLTGGFGQRNFTLGAPSGPQGELAAQVAVEQYGPTAIVLRDVTSPEALAFCDGFERAFRELGGSVVYRDEFSYDTLEPVQDRLAERGSDTSFIAVCSHVPGAVDAAPSIILNLRTLGFSAPILAGSSVDETGWFSLVPTLGELTFVSWSSAFGNDPDERINDVTQRASQNPDTPGPGVSTILGAETIEAWARAVEAAGDDSPDRIASALAAFNDEEFSTGEITFSSGARMDVGRIYRVLQVVEGELSVIALEETED